METSEAIKIVKFYLKDDGHLPEKAEFTFDNFYKALNHAIEYMETPKYKRVDLENMRCMGVFTSNPGSNFTRGYNQAIDDIKSKYGDLYVEVK